MYWAMALRNPDVRNPEVARDAERNRLTREAHISHGTSSKPSRGERAPLSEAKQNERLAIDESSMMAERL